MPCVCAVLCPAFVLKSVHARNHVWQLAAPRVVAAVKPDVKAAVPRVSKATRVAVISAPSLREGTEVSAAKWSFAKRPVPRGSPAKPVFTTPPMKANRFSGLPLEEDDDAPPKSSFKGPGVKLAPPTKSKWSSGAIIRCLATVAVLAICTGGVCSLGHPSFKTNSACNSGAKNPGLPYQHREGIKHARATSLSTAAHATCPRSNDQTDFMLTIDVRVTKVRLSPYRCIRVRDSHFWVHRVAHFSSAVLSAGCW